MPIQANPEMMKPAMDMMGQIDPEQMAAMMASMQSGSASGQPDPSAMAGLLSDPKSRELMRQMMSSVDPQQLATMSKAAGHTLTPEQVPLQLHTSLSCQLRVHPVNAMLPCIHLCQWISAGLPARLTGEQQCAAGRGDELSDEEHVRCTDGEAAHHHVLASECIKCSAEG